MGAKPEEPVISPVELLMNPGIERIRSYTPGYVDFRRPNEAISDWSLSQYRRSSDTGGKYIIKLSGQPNSRISSPRRTYSRHLTPSADTSYDSNNNDWNSGADMLNPATPMGVAVFGTLNDSSSDTFDNSGD